ncbi:MAG: hypothetical protein M2R45_02797 [Verrucomicrobia subdivision 3 bacterium]|nr:hypothetical protein [Limisphaerales bacterium]MCS1414349.1 hypothetical protein [Limisphaerales bacterium]
MILILADDLSGAAELAGIAAAQGYTAEVQTVIDTSSRAEVLAVDAQSRSCSPAEAKQRVRNAYTLARSLGPKWTYKKTDSALRGNIVAELETVAQTGGYERILFIPANPEKKRYITDGIYRINGIPLDQTVFAHDPEYPQQQAEVIKALGHQGSLPRTNVSADQSSPRTGIVIPDVFTGEDLDFRATEVHDQTLPAGAAEFFSSLLNRVKDPAHETCIERQVLSTSTSRLFICGSLASWQQGLASFAAKHDVPVFPVDSTEDGIQKAVESLRIRQRAMIAIGQPDASVRQHDGWGDSENLLARLVDIAVAIIQQTTPSQLFIEGGATASALLKRMGWTRFEAATTTFTGVGCLHPKDTRSNTLLCIKPGSYPWPKAAWISATHSSP